MTRLIGFRGMQDCFRLHPEMYASELEDEEDEIEEELRAREASPPVEESLSSESAKVSTPSQSPATEATESKPVEQPHRESSSTIPEKVHKVGDEGEELLPKATQDAVSK